MRTTIAIFCKHPKPGLVKTRLAESTSPAWAATVAEAFLLDTMHQSRQLADARYLIFAPPSEAEYFTKVAAGEFQLLPQADGDLGNRLRKAFEHLLEHECDALVVIGTDSPTLPSAYIEEALAKLESADVVLGPATDGGYYLVGCARRVAPIFDGISWGGNRVFAETIACLKKARIQPGLLPPWYDIDTLEDWRFLQSHLQGLEQAGENPIALNTRAVKDFVRNA